MGEPFVLFPAHISGAHMGSGFATRDGEVRFFQHWRGTEFFDKAFSKAADERWILRIGKGYQAFPRTTLPKGWEETVDANDKPYYVNKSGQPCHARHRVPCAFKDHFLEGQVLSGEGTHTRPDHPWGPIAAGPVPIGPIRARARATELATVQLMVVEKDGWASKLSAQIRQPNLFNRLTYAPYGREEDYPYHNVRFLKYPFLPDGWVKGHKRRDVEYRYYENKDGRPWINTMPRADRINKPKEVTPNKPEFTPF